VSECILGRSLTFIREKKFLRVFFIRSPKEEGNPDGTGSVLEQEKERDPD